MILLVCVQAQRAGRQAPDSSTLFPNVWTWKKPGYTNVCTAAIMQYDGGDGEASNLKDYPGYFEAGSTLPSSCDSSLYLFGT